MAIGKQQQQREAARRRIERRQELLQRREKEQRGKRRRTLLLSVGATVVVVALVVVLVVTLGGGGSDKKSTASSGSAAAASSAASSPAASSPAASTAESSPAPTSAAPTSYPAAKGASVSFQGVTVTGATDLKGVPTVTSAGTTDPAKLEYKDLVVGKGAAATPTSSVTVQYVGVLYKNGKTPFDSSWARGAPTQFPLTGVVPGFTQGIGGTTGVPAMRVGGRRIVIMPAALAYGSQAQQGIPANSPLVFVIDLVKV